MFAAKGDYVFGLVDGDLKYSYDFDRKQEELYDLSSDPAENHDLSGKPQVASTMRQYRLRIEGWLSFQNGYIESLIPPRPQ